MNIEKRIWSIMFLEEIIKNTFEKPSSFPRELIAHIMSFFPESDWIIEEVHRGEISNRGLISKITDFDNFGMDGGGGWSRSNQIIAYNGLKLKYRAFPGNGSWYCMGIAEKDCECGIKFGKGRLEDQNGSLNLLYFSNYFERIFGFNPDIDSVVNEKYSTIIDDFQLIEKMRKLNEGKNIILSHEAPKMDPDENIFELYFSIDKFKNAFVSIKLNGEFIHLFIHYLLSFLLSSLFS